MSRGATVSSGLLSSKPPNEGASEEFLVRETLKGSSAGDISRAGLISPRAELGSGDVGGNLKFPSDCFLLSPALGVPGAVLCLDVRLLGFGRIGTLKSVCDRPRGGGDELKKGDGCSGRAAAWTELC